MRSRAETEHAITIQVKLLREVIRTEEPTEQATALLEGFATKQRREQLQTRAKSLVAHETASIAKK
jgi:hypothetical protein